MSKQSTYLLPNAGGFESFVQAVGTPGEREDSPSESLNGNTREISSDTGSSSVSEYFSPVSHMEVPRVASFSIDEPAISEEEREATAPVQGLLDRMNHFSSRMIEVEQHIHSIEEKRRVVAHDWSEKKNELRHEIGVHAIEKTRPIFDAYEHQLQLQAAVNEATLLYNQSVIECDEMKIALTTASENGSTEAHLGELLAMLVSVQTKRDTYDHLSMGRTNEFKQAQEKVIQLRKHVGLRAVERAWPWFEAFMHSKGISEELTQKIHALSKEMASLREEYRDCMHELEAISAKVHAIRKSLENT